MTVDGEAINLNEYCAWIADTRYEDSFASYQKNSSQQNDKPFSSRTLVIQLTNFYCDRNRMNECFIKSSKEEFEQLKGLKGKLD